MAEKYQVFAYDDPEGRMDNEMDNLIIADCWFNFLYSKGYNYIRLYQGEILIKKYDNFLHNSIPEEEEVNI